MASSIKIIRPVSVMNNNTPKLSKTVINCVQTYTIFLSHVLWLSEFHGRNIILPFVLYPTVCLSVVCLTNLEHSACSQRFTYRYLFLQFLLLVTLWKGTIAVSFNSQLWEMEWVAGSQCPSKQIILCMMSIFLHINRCKYGAFGKYTTFYESNTHDLIQREVDNQFVN